MYVVVPLTVVNFISIDPPVPLVDMSEQLEQLPRAEENMKDRGSIEIESKKRVRQNGKLDGAKAKESQQRLISNALPPPSSLQDSSNRYPTLSDKPPVVSTPPRRPRGPSAHFMQPPHQRADSEPLPTWLRVTADQQRRQQQPRRPSAKDDVALHAAEYDSRPTMPPRSQSMVPAPSNGFLQAVSLPQTSMRLTPNAAASEPASLRVRSETTSSLHDTEMEWDDTHWRVGQQMLRESFAFSDINSAHFASEAAAGSERMPASLSLRTVARSGTLAPAVVKAAVQRRQPEAHIVVAPRPQRVKHITWLEGFDKKTAPEAAVTAGSARPVTSRETTLPMGKPNWKTELRARRSTAGAQHAVQQPAPTPIRSQSGVVREPSPADDENESTTSDMYHSDVDPDTESSSHTGTAMYTMGRAGIRSMPTFQVTAASDDGALGARPQQLTPFGYEVGAQWSSDEDEHKRERPMNVETRAGKALWNGMSSVRFQAPLFH